MKITYYGQSCFGVHVNNKHLLFDPFISGNPFATKINIDDIPCDYMLISHGHFDHIKDAIAIAERTNCKVICNWEIHEWMATKGITNIHPMNIGGKWKFEFGYVKCVNAVHSSSMPDGTYGGNPVGFVVYSDDISFYFAGDTALTMDMQLIPMTCPVLNFAILPLGDNFTMDVDDAVIAAEFIHCTTIIGCHFDTFEMINIDHEFASKAFKKEGKELILPKVGQVISL
jgi:L-ascorbate metabolism protein UlaG (beta-lactamase superfamily)